MRPSGLAGFLALFAILCTIFSGIVTVAEFAGHPERLQLDLEFVAVAGSAAVVMLMLARHLRSHEAVTPEAPVDPNAPHVGWGIFAASLGLVIIGVAGYRLATVVQHPKPDDFIVVPAGLMFFFAGVLMALPAHWARSRSILSALLMTAFAVTFDWVAFGPGERHFSGGFSAGFLGTGFSPGQLTGRIAFGLFGVVTTVLAVMAWARVIPGAATQR